MKKRLFSLLMVLSLICTMLPTSVFAVEAEYVPLDNVYITEHNPLYPYDDCGVEEYAPTVDALHPLQGGQYEDDLSVAAATIRTAMENRQSTVSVNVFLDGDTHDGSEASNKAMMRGIFHDAYAHTGNPTQGDYLKWVYNTMSAGASGYISWGDYYYTITYTITYYTTAAQEQEVTNKLSQVMPTFGFTSATTDYEKVKAVHDYICANVTYDHENLENESYKLKYTAYAALINGTSVCQGYATLLYRMLLMAGVDTRVVIGTAGGGDHGWNIVKLGDVYYNVDSTWDAGETEYDYFLTCPASFDPSHTRDAEYTTAAFNAAYPMASEDYDPNMTSGIPEGLTYTISGNYVTITGYTGPLTELTIPDTIEGKAVTSIGDSAFKNCTALKTVNIPHSVTSIGSSAFYNSGLTSITIPDSVKTIGRIAFNNCNNLSFAKIGSGAAVDYITFHSCPNLARIEVDSKNPYNSSDAYGVLFNKAKTTLVKCPEGFSGAYTIPDSVTAIGENAFYGCVKLTSVSIPSEVDSIGHMAFHSCYELGEITIPASVTFIGKQAFIFCDGTVIYFEGNAPAMSNTTFSYTTTTAYYPCDNDTWTDEAIADLTDDHPTITWEPNHNFVEGACSKCGDEDPGLLASFADIPADSWQYPFAQYAVKNGLMAGKGTDADGNIIFDPNSPIKREEFVQVLYNAEGKPAISIANPFPDVADGGWYKSAVLWAKQNDIASGKGNGNFGVGENISRQDLAMMLYKYAKLNGYSLEATNGLINQFADGASVASYAKTAMDWAVTNGIMSGKGAAGADLSTFRLDPTGIATRAECAAMLKNFQTAFGG